MGIETGHRGLSRTTQVALVVLIVVIWAVFGIMAGVLVSTRKGGANLRGIVDGVTGVRTLSFIVLLPLGAYGFHRLAGWVAGRFAWDDRTRWLAVFSAWFVLGVGLAVGLWGFAAIGLLQFAWGAMIPLGCAFLGLGLQRRVGTELHCAACGYPYSDEVGSQCPECGAVWSDRGGATPGRPVRSPVLVATGVLLLLLSIALTLTPLAGGRINRVVPTAYLIERVEAGGWSGAWAELMTRTLTAEQKGTLARVLLDRRVEMGRLDRQSAAWLETAATGGGIDRDLSDRYFDEMVVLALRERGREDGFVEVEVYADNRSLPFGSVEARIIFGGFAIDGEPVAGSRMERYASVYRFDPWFVARKPEESLPSVVVGPRPVGRSVVVTAEAWVLYGGANQLSWGDAWGGAARPMIPPGLARVEHFTLSIEIRPGG